MWGAVGGSWSRHRCPQRRRCHAVRSGLLGGGGGMAGMAGNRHVLIHSVAQVAVQECYGEMTEWLKAQLTARGLAIPEVLPPDDGDIVEDGEEGEGV